MLFSEPLDSVLGQVSKTRILRFLVLSQAELNGREVARAVGLSHVKCHAALRELAAHGFIRMRKTGRSVLYQLDFSKVLVRKLLKPLFEGEQALLNGLVRAVRSELKAPLPLSIIIFGSIARGDARPDSDIDLMAVMPPGKPLRAARDEFDGAEEKVERLFGNRLAPIVISESSFRKRYRKGDPLITEAVRTGRVLSGKSPAELLAR